MIMMLDHLGINTEVSDDSMKSAELSKYKELL